MRASKGTRTSDYDEESQSLLHQRSRRDSLSSVSSSVVFVKHGVSAELELGEISGCPVSGPGLVVMLADSDAGSLIVSAQSGKVWGYSLVGLQFILAAPLFMAQELTVRLGTATQTGYAKLVSTHYGTAWGALICALLCTICIGALISEYTAIIGVGNMVGIPPLYTCAMLSTALFTITLKGKYEEVERAALFLGCFEFAFFVTMVMSMPDPVVLGKGLVTLPVQDRGFDVLVAANIGAVMQPWMIFYQQSAVVDKKTKDGAEFRKAIHETKWGAVITQAVAVAVMLSAAGAMWKSEEGATEGFDTVEDISKTMSTHLGVMGEVLFALGFFGSAAIGAVVVSLTAVWSISELSGWNATLESSCADAPLFYSTFAAILILASYASLSDINMITLNVAIQVFNSVLLPVILGFLYRMATNPDILPEEYLLTGTRKGVYAASFGLCSLVGVYCTAATLFG